MIAAFFACGNHNVDYTAYFGGEVTNPSSPYIILTKDNVPVDTLKLDKDHRFFKKFDSLTPGMYCFQHGPGYQYVYFDRNDSIMVSANGENFDNSVMFSGRGDRKNNFLMELYLLNEKDRADSYNDYDKEYKPFSKTIDSVYNLRKKFYERNKTSIQWSDGFDLYARIRTDMSYYTKKEYYRVIHARRTGKDIGSELPPDFYAYRKNIDFNNYSISQFSPFARYVNALLTNMSVSRHYRSGVAEEDLLQDNIARLDIADSIFRNERIRNQMLNNIAFSYLLEDQKSGNNQKFLQHYMRLSTDKSPSNEIRKIAQALQKLQPGMPLPEVALAGNNGSVPSLISPQSKTVVLFWTGCAPTHMENLLARMREIQHLCPRVHIVAVNVDEEAEWRRAVGRMNLEGVVQARAKNFTELKNKWAFTRINKAIVLDKNGKIISAVGNILDPAFDDLLR